MIAPTPFTPPLTQETLVLVPRERRIIAIERDGLRRIIGVSLTQPPDLLKALDEEERPIFFSLVKCTRTSWVYKEIVPPEVNHNFGDGTFKPNQV